MSKLREDIPAVDGDLSFPAEGDLKPYVIFTQLKDGGPYLYAGWVNAADDEMAVQFAREHYGQDQECVNLWAIPRPAIAGTEAEYPASDEEGPPRPFHVFVQEKAGNRHVSAGTVEAASSAAALELAKQQVEGAPGSIWVVRRDAIAATDPDDVIWRFTSQDYRMARGYAADVREKWEKIRRDRDLAEYEKDDLKETF